MTRARDFFAEGMPGHVWEKKNLELEQPLLDDAVDGAPECVVRHPDDDEDGLGLGKTEYYRWDLLRWGISQLLAIFTCGISLLVFRWCPVWALVCTHRRSSASRATCVLAEGTDGIATVIPIKPVLEVDAPEGDAPAPGELPSAPPVAAVNAFYEKRGANRVEIPRRFEFRHMLYFETRSTPKPAPQLPESSDATSYPWLSTGERPRLSSDAGDIFPRTLRSHFHSCNPGSPPPPFSYLGARVVPQDTVFSQRRGVGCACLARNVHAIHPVPSETPTAC